MFQDHARIEVQAGRGGDGEAEIAPKGAQVTAKVVKHVLGDKILVGKYKPKKGYRKHIGHRSRLSQVQIESIAKKPPARKPAEEKPAASAKKPAAKKEDE